jgi:energy-coupling factor transport system ATP-binding protein
MPVITIDHLKYKYPGTDRLALDDISLTIEKGEFIGIVGRNGAGKSTLSQAIIGLVPQFYKGAYGGKVLVNGVQADTCPVAEMCEKVGLVFQNPFNQLSGASETVYGEVAFGLQNLGIPAEEMKQRIEKVMKWLDIWEYKDRNPFNLSGGQMQRVAIASVLVMQPEVIILDEPTSQLDPEGSEQVFHVVDQLTEAGFTVIMVEQKMEKIAKYCNRVILMNQGKVVDFDTPEKIFSRDDLEDFGVTPPVFTKACRKYGLKRPDGTYPVVLEEAVSSFREGGKQVETVIRPKEQTKSETVFTLENLEFAYDTTKIFQKLNLLLDRKATAIVGQNGAGKTTLVRLMKGLLKPGAGKIWFGTEDISGKTVAMLADKVGYVFQNPDDQIFKYNVLEEVMYGPLNIGMSEEEAKEKSLKALELMGLKGKENHNPYDLELNERKMIAIASILAMDTDVVILDEPTIAQDYPGRQLIGHMIQVLSEEGKLVIAILHDMDFVEEYFERVIIMSRGKILFDGHVEDAFSQDAILKEACLKKPYYTELAESI